MRVVLFSRFPTEIDRPKGGVESATVGLAKGLAQRQGIDLHIVTLEKGVDRVRVEEFGTITVHRLPGNRWPMILDVFGGPGRRSIDAYISGLEPDIVHFQETYGFGGPHPDYPSVFTVHGFDSLNLVSEKKYLWRIRSPLWRLAEKQGIGSHRFLVSIAPYVTEELSKLSSSEITAIPNAINPDFFEVPRNVVPGRIFFAGWINNRKNLLSALRALNILVRNGTHISLHAAGAFVDQKYLQRLKDYISENGLDDSHVQLLGRIGQDRLRQELSEAEAFVLPSYQENAPMAIAEAMAAGVPVVTSDVCGMPYMVEDGKTGFLTNPDDSLMIAEKLRILLENSTMREQFGVHAKRYAEQTYHPNSVVEATMAMYSLAMGAG